ncbi:TAXI family TRAP transporter solute-binding subunit [Methylobrevis albus]|uniref:TRAP transporter solute receptor, TAXI family n=1 Tax=Methylobrevis albus TaxID=2793297 RepID=A0A931N0A0_9HYPH|nr:TAXI family TRAP transporter solute-binding subunit [Methylobrevis albus]MBH0238571.1 hypothetical protein [Methylobrevis albus]
MQSEVAIFSGAWAVVVAACRAACAGIALTAALACLVATLPAAAREPWRVPVDDLPRVVYSDAERLDIHDAQVGIVTGAHVGSYAELGDDIVRLLNDRAGRSLRILAVTGQGSINSVDDLRNLRGIDFAIVQSDVLEAYEGTPAGAELRRTLRYVSRLHTEQLHVLTRTSVAGDDAVDVCALAGRRITVNVGGPRSGTALTVRTIMQGMLGLDLAFDPSTSGSEGLKQLADGRVDALAFVVGKPASLFRDISPEDFDRLGLRFLAVPVARLETGCAGGPQPAVRLSGTSYEASAITAADYPALLAIGEEIPTIGVPAVLAAYAWPEGKGRFAQARRFVEALFARGTAASGGFGDAARGFSPKWCGIDFARDVRGLERFSVAADLVAAAAPGSLRIDCAGATRSLAPVAPAPDCGSEAGVLKAFADWYETQPDRSTAPDLVARAYTDFRARVCRP